ncbi:olfactory receptor 2AT4-like [Protobothrops mucrosquamatus]|uniref:olfactory receptor 2AT4-like n=1 Tax=Protobothrops mucrosquamatus TaxID=103944 RepID=UPI000775FAB0|nr:olfactory receptor 2AT4-like [Protobothrops mucrosquamatus]
MESCNFTGGSVPYFWLVGFPSLQDHQFPLFFVFLAFYLLILSSNVTIIAAVATDPKLHKPMYFFLTNLSILDILLTTIIIPQMLAMFSLNARSISSKGCFLQMYFFHGLAVTETFLLVAMSYDRYEAICHPLHYAVRMTRQKNAQLAATAWFFGLLVAIPPVVQSSQLTFRKRPRVNHCFCDHLAVVQAACQNAYTTFQSFMGFTISMTVAFGPLLLVVISYACIMVSVLQIRSKEGRRKTFSTCFSHLVVVITYYSSIALAFLSYRVEMSSDVHILSDMTFSILTPLVNPLIYTLRNRDIKRAVRQLASSKVFSTQKERLCLDHVETKEI